MLSTAEVKMSNPLRDLAKPGQSVWFDQMERRLVTSGELQRMIDEDDLRGLTSNPTIFEKAIGGSDDYEAQLRTLASQNKSRDEIYDAITIEDIGNAADVFRPVYDRCKGGDGFCSLEVSPILASDTAGTAAEAKRLFATLGRPNVMIRLRATAEGIPAIEESIAAGININITLIFSNDVYAKVMEAYLRGLERRVAQSLPINEISSVASFFVSRIDALAEKQIEAKLKEKDDPEVRALMGKIAIANAKLAYQLFKETFSGARWEALRHHGANVQRPLWASTGTKNPAYSDVLYIESLIGADTVNTVPPATYKAFKDHCRVAMTLEADLDEAREVMRKLAEKGFTLKALTDKLTDDGVKSFDESFASLLATIEARRDEAIRGLARRQSLHLGAAQAVVDQAAQRVEKEKFVERIWKKDTTLWKNDDAHKKIISNALGWLTVAEAMSNVAKELMAFADSVKADFDDVIVLGMGGSSLCSEVTRRLFGKRSGDPRVNGVGSTVPPAVHARESNSNLPRT